MVIRNTKKRVFDIIFICTILIVVSSYLMPVYGSESDEEDEFLNKYNMTEMKPTEEKYFQCIELNDKVNRMVMSIDINQKGMLALLLENRNVLIYDENLSLIHSYQLGTEGDYIKWFGRDLFVYDGKSGIAILFDINNNTEKVYKEDENHSSQLWEYFLNAKHKHDHYYYDLSKKKDKVKRAFWDTTPYPYVLRTDINNENVEVIYSAEKAYIVREIVLWGVACIVLLVLVISFLRRSVLEKKEQIKFVKESVAKKSNYIKSTGEMYTYAVNQNKKEYINTKKAKYMINNSSYSMNPGAVLFEFSPKGEIQGRWLEDDIVWSDVKPPDEYKDISDLLMKYYSDIV